MAVIKFEVEVDSEGEAIIRLPEGPGQQRNAGIVASFTEKLAKLLGKVKERHIGHHHHHDTNVDHIHEQN